MTGIKPIIEANELLFTKNEEPLTLQVGTTDTLCLIGPDSGRLYQTQQILAGVEPPQSGELRLLGRPLAELNKRSWREQRQHIGYVARGAPLLSVLRGLDNVMLPALYHKRLSRPEAQQRAMELLTQLDFSGDTQALPAYLSPLQRLQLAIARATILEPAVLFVEGPFYGLSPTDQQPIYRYFTDSQKQRAQVIATHNLKLVKSCATQILFIGEQAHHHFSGWQDLISSSIDEVTNFLLLYRQQNPLS